MDMALPLLAFLAYKSRIIRFPEEVKCWSFLFMKTIPLNELPQKRDFINTR